MNRRKGNQSCSNESCDVLSFDEQEPTISVLNIKQPTCYSININSIKKSSLFKNDEANIKVGRAFFIS